MEARSKTVTIRDVARAAGVSTSTVSRVLDERLAPSQSPAAQRVREAVRTLGYRRHLSASSLRRGFSSTIGVLVPRLTDIVMALLYEEIARSCARVDKFALVATTDDDPILGRKAVTALLQRGVDGLIVATARDHDVDDGPLMDVDVPLVLALRSHGQECAAVGDDELGGYLATRHLLDLGHRRIGVISGPGYASSAAGRLRGSFRALSEAGVTADDELVVGSSFQAEPADPHCRELLSLTDRPTAIFAMNDAAAISAYFALTRLGLSVPSDMSLVGYNDTPLASMLPTPLTSVRVPFDQIAQAALDLLDHPPVAPRDRVRTVATTLIPRASTSSPGSS